MFNPVPTRIEDILSSPCFYAIPIYQREYNWGREEALELIEDLKSYMDTEGDSLFLGNLIIERAKGHKAFIVDGQQRLTTILLLLVACRMRARQLGLAKLEPRIQEKITFIDSTTGESSGCRLIASDSVREVFEQMADGNWDGKFVNVIGKKPVKRKVNRIKPIYDSFLKEVSELDQPELSKFLKAIYNSYVARIEVESDVEALSIFERTNARGMELEISDLLKNYLFIKQVEGIEDQWKQIQNNSCGTILRMLKYFYVSKKGYVLKPQLYKKLKGYGAEVGAQQLSEHLATFSKFYRVVRNPEAFSAKDFFEEKQIPEISNYEDRCQKINRALEALREFKIVQFCPPAYAAIENLVRNGVQSKPQEAKILVRLFESFEKYHFINNVVCERVGNEVEKLYADACVWYSESGNFIETTHRLIGELKSRLAKEDEFVANFVELGYSTDQIPLICYIFDRFNNCGLDPGQCLRIFNPDPKFLRRNHNIEHFLPQQPDPDLKIKKTDLDSVDNIGNLLVIYFKDNSSLGNASPVEKIKRLKGDLRQHSQNLPYVVDFVDGYSADAASWGSESIRRRAGDMALETYRKAWKIG